METKSNGAAEHRFWYFVNIPEIGIRWQQGWCFGTDALSAARNAIKWIGQTTKQAQFLNANDVHVNRDCNCCR